MLIVQLLPVDTVGRWLSPGGAAWLASEIGGHSIWLWVVMVSIFAYYMVATLLPIDALIGRLYPFLAIALLIMVGGLSLAILRGQMPLPDFTLANLHPGGLASWPIIFITVSCGAVSGFHATQSPLMARCLKNERSMRPVFYGAMIAEGFIALVWASAAQGFYAGPEALSAALTSGGPGQVVHDICVTTMGKFGGVLALLGVVVLPITSGDTAFRVGRLIAADYLGLSQHRVRNRYLIALPMFAMSIGLNFVNFATVWRYFGWANQTLAAVTLWAGAVFLARRQSSWWLAVPPAVFMTVVTTTYILVEKSGFGISYPIGVGIGIALGAASMIIFLVVRPRLEPEGDEAVVRVAPSEAERNS